MTPFRKAVLDDGTKKTRYDLLQMFKRRFDIAKSDLNTTSIHTPSMKQLEEMFQIIDGDDQPPSESDKPQA